MIVGLILILTPPTLGACRHLPLTALPYLRHWRYWRRTGKSDGLWTPTRAKAQDIWSSRNSLENHIVRQWLTANEGTLDTNDLWAQRYTIQIYMSHSHSAFKKIFSGRPTTKIFAGTNTSEISEMTLFLVSYTEISNIS